jgi:transcriptional regulator with XRE-family HTH domain
VRFSAQEDHDMHEWTIHTPQDLGRAISGLRRERMLTQEEVAAMTGVERTYLAKLEGGRSVKQVERALRILRRLGAEVTVKTTRPT